MDSVSSSVADKLQKSLMQLRMLSQLNPRCKQIHLFLTSIIETVRVGDVDVGIRFQLQVIILLFFAEFHGKLKLPSEPIRKARSSVHAFGSNMVDLISTILEHRRLALNDRFVVKCPT